MPRDNPFVGVSPSVLFLISVFLPERGRSLVGLGLDTHSVVTVLCGGGDPLPPTGLPDRGINIRSHSHGSSRYRPRELGASLSLLPLAQQPPLPSSVTPKIFPFSRYLRSVSGSRGRASFVFPSVHDRTSLRLLYIYFVHSTGFTLLSSNFHSRRNSVFSHRRPERPEGTTFFLSEIRDLIQGTDRSNYRSFVPVPSPVLISPRVQGTFVLPSHVIQIIGFISYSCQNGDPQRPFPAAVFLD